MSPDQIATHPPPVPSVDASDEETLLVEDARFSIVPEWMIDADVPDAAFRLYALLLRYGNTSGSRMPSRSTLARRLRRSVDAVDRAMRQLTVAGIVRVEHRRRGAQYLSNRYHVRTSSPIPPARGDRNSAATSDSVLSASEELPGGSRNNAARAARESAARVAAPERHDREPLTEPPPPLTPPRPRALRQAAVEEADATMLATCGIGDLQALAERCQKARRALGRSATRWSAPCLLVAIKLAIVRGWPALQIPGALLIVAADPVTQSPARVAEAGPWWDDVVLGFESRLDPRELAALEWRLSETNGLRAALQRQARAELAAEGIPANRTTVAQRACRLLDALESAQAEPAPASGFGTAAQGGSR